MTDHQPDDRGKTAVASTQHRGVLRRILNALNGGLFTRVAVLFGAAQRIVPPAP